MLTGNARYVRGPPIRISGSHNGIYIQTESFRPACDMKYPAINGAGFNAQPAATAPIRQTDCANTSQSA